MYCQSSHAFIHCYELLYATIDCATALLAPISNAVDLPSSTDLSLELLPLSLR